MPDSRERAGKVPDEPRTSYCAKKPVYSNLDVDISKGNRSQLEGAPMGQIWGNLNIKINNDSSSL